MKIFNKIKATLKQEHELIGKNTEEIYKKNYSLATLGLLVLVACFTVLSVLSFFLEAYKPTRLIYLLLVVYFLAVYCFFRFYKKKIPLRILYYFHFALIFTYTIYSGAFVYNNYINTMVLAALALMPILILDYTVVVSSLEILFALAYVLMISFKKEPSLVIDEIINVVLFLIIGLGIGYLLRQTRLGYTELIRKSIMRENTDVLMEIANRRKLFYYFDKSCKKGFTEPITAVAMVDIDLFKSYNDVYGHVVADCVLKRLGKMFNEYGEKHNTVFYRYGGEEIVAVCHEPDKAVAKKIVTNICKEVLKLKIEHSNSATGYLTVSIGYVLLDIKANTKIGSENGLDIDFNFEKILSNADDALYCAKNSGRNCAVDYFNKEAKC